MNSGMDPSVTVRRLLEEQVLRPLHNLHCMKFRNSSNVAIITESEVITFGKLQLITSCIIRKFIQLGCNASSIVGICVAPSLYQIGCILAAIKLGKNPNRYSLRRCNLHSFGSRVSI